MLNLKSGRMRKGTETKKEPLGKVASCVDASVGPFGRQQVTKRVRKFVMG